MLFYCIFMGRRYSKVFGTLEFVETGFDLYSTCMP